MNNNDSPKTLNNTKEIEEIENKIIYAQEKRKKPKHKKKKKNYFKSLNSVVLNINNNSNDNLFFDDNSKSHYYKYVGNTIFLFMNKYGDPLLIIGPHWPLFACFFGTINILYFITIFKLWNRFGFKSKLVNQISYWTFTLSYSYTALINPGYPKNNRDRKNGYPRDEFYFCNECKFYVKRSNDASHCDDCGICVEGMDHHCPWTSHCVGKNNIISFYIFIIATLFSICYLPLAFCHFLK